MNIETRAWNDILASSLTATLLECFEYVVALPTAEPPNTLGNMVLLASQKPLEFPEERLPHPRDYVDRGYLHWVVLRKNHAWDNRFVPETRGVPILTDDRTVVDLWAEQINLAARRELHEYFGSDGLSW